MRRCPRCTFPLDVVTHNDVELDHCRRCGGTFLDPGEETEILGAPTSATVWKNSSAARALGPSPLKCPEDNVPFTTYVVEFDDQRVEVELCERCAGMWLDAKECQTLRDLLIEAGQSKKTTLTDQPSVRSYMFQLLSGLPLEVWNPRHRSPWLTISLISVLYVVFALELLAPRELIQVFALIPAEVLGGGEFWRLITYAFFHLGLAHLIGNTYFFYIFGDNVEDTLRTRRFLFLFLASTVAGSLLETVFWSRSTTPEIGASGAVAGLMGAYLVLFPRVKLYLVLFFIRFRLGVLWYLGFWIAYNVMMALIGGEGVAWLAHIGGFVAGGLIAYRYRFRPLHEQLRR